MRHLLPILCACAALVGGSAYAQSDKPAVGTSYKADWAICVDKKAIEPLKQAEAEGHAVEMWGLLVKAGVCGVVPDMAGKIVSVDDEYTSRDGHKIYVVTVEFVVMGKTVRAYGGVLGGEAL